MISAALRNAVNSFPNVILDSNTNSFYIDIRMRTTKCLSLDESLVREVEHTIGKSSVSERVNVLLKAALEWERQQGLYSEAERFFSSESDEDRGARKAFQTASIRSLARED